MADSWEVDPAHSTIEFSVKHMMFTTVRGRFKSFKGTIKADEKSPDRSSVTVEIDASSIDTGAGDRDAHLKSADFLDVATHPTITFRSKRVAGAASKEGDRFKLTGDLTIRGKTMEITLDCTYQGRGKDPWGKERAGASATGEIDRRQWGLQWNQALETGGVLVGNAVKFELDVQAVHGAATAVA
ncbi:MAG TPA: YceI family protein [Thermoanaerobaculia bacterium]|nr:YceI family protein [Thermoanaerobaculia bacterium]